MEENIKKSVAEYQLLSHILTSGNEDLLKEPILGPQHFNTPIKDGNGATVSNTKDVYRFILDHFNTYKKIPDTTTVLSHFPDLDIVEVNESEDYLIRTLDNMYKNDKFLDMLMGSNQKLANSQNTKEAWDYLMGYEQMFNGVPIGKIGIDLIHEGADDRLKMYEDAHNDPEATFVKSGLPEIDALLGGFCRTEELVAIQARTGNSKTFLLLKFLYEAWLAGERVALYSPEMSSQMIGYRFDSYHGGLSNSRLRKGEQVDSNYKHYVNHLKEKDNCFYHLGLNDFKGGCTVSKLKQFCKDNKITVLGIDGIRVPQYMQDEHATRNTPVWDQVGNVMNDLKQLSQDMHIPVITVAQAGRMGKDEEIDTDTVGGSYQISTIATLMFSIKKAGHEVTLRIIKNRGNEDSTEFKYIVDLDKGKWMNTSAADVELSTGGSSVDNKREKVKMEPDSGSNTFNQDVADNNDNYGEMFSNS